MNKKNVNNERSVRAVQIHALRPICSTFPRCQIYAHHSGGAVQRKRPARGARRVTSGAGSGAVQGAAHGARRVISKGTGQGRGHTTRHELGKGRGRCERAAHIIG